MNIQARVFIRYCPTQVYHRYVLGLYRIFEARINCDRGTGWALPCCDRSWQVITSSFPHVLFESCAFATSVRIWTSSTDFRWKWN